MKKASVPWAVVALGLPLCLLAWVGLGGAQPRSGRTEFEVVSLKYTGQLMDQQIVKNGISVGTRTRQVEFKGRRLSGNTSLYGYLEFAFPGLALSARFDATREDYQIEALAPEGTTLDEARTMLRRVLADRLGFQYHLVDRKTPVYYLVRGSGALRLAPSSEPKPSAIQSTYMFKSKAAPIEKLALFFRSLTDREVVDKTGIQGLYSFDIDFTKVLQDEPDIRTALTNLALAEAKRLGLKLQPGEETRKYFQIDHVNKYPTAN